jgi:hypothetical protein
MKTKPIAAPTELSRLRRENRTLRTLLRQGVEWGGLERDTPEEDLVTPDWRIDAEALLGGFDGG